MSLIWLLGPATFLAAAEGASARSRRIEPAEAARMMTVDDALVLDVRAAFEKRQRPWGSRPAGLIVVPYGDHQWNGDLGTAEVETFLQRLSASRPRRSQIVIVICERGLRSRYAARALRDRGYRAVSVEHGIWGDDAHVGLDQALFEERTFGSVE